MTRDMRHATCGRDERHLVRVSLTPRIASVLSVAFRVFSGLLHVGHAPSFGGKGLPSSSSSPICHTDRRLSLSSHDSNPPAHA